MLNQIRKHLAKWVNHPLSLAGRIMVSNQVILSSIWYLASCTDLIGKTLKIARATVRNYIWSGKKESFARARVKWDTAMLPIVRGGIKILDPLAVLGTTGQTFNPRAICWIRTLEGPGPIKSCTNPTIQKRPLACSLKLDHKC